MDPIPTPKRCLELLEEHGCSREVIEHSKAVRDIAVKIAQRIGADVNLVEAGALLHDIGRSKTHGVLHGVEGVKIGKKIGLPINIILIIERHLGAGIPKDEAVKLGLPEKDYLPETIEEKIVAHADNLIQDGKRQNIEEEIQRAKKKGLTQFAQRLLLLHSELSDRCGIDLDDI
jgi:uncharacterized protein (TIGR00295 family)